MTTSKAGTLASQNGSRTVAHLLNLVNSLTLMQTLLCCVQPRTTNDAYTVQPPKQVHITLQYNPPTFVGVYARSRSLLFLYFDPRSHPN